MNFTMNILKTVFVLSLLLFIFHACDTINNDTPDVELKPDISVCIEKYKNELKSEDIIINATSNDTSNVVHVAVFNAKQFPEWDYEQKELAMNIAGDILPLINNKDDFSVIEIEYVYEILQACDPHYSFIHKISYKEIEEFLREEI